MHQPLGLILPVTTEHLFGFLKSEHPEHFAPLGPGLSMYLNCFLLSAACAEESVAPRASTSGAIASRFKTKAREIVARFMRGSLPSLKSLSWQIARGRRFAG